MTTEKIYFASANTRNGFYSLFDKRFAKIQKLYILKGGPGTGKGRFLHEVAERGKEKGYLVEQILCSSDPQSLDAVILQKGELSFAVADGTAPHVFEPTVPGVCEELIDLGAFWNSTQLEQNKSRILTLEQYRRASWARAYDALAAAGKTEDIASSLCMPTLHPAAVCKLAQRLLAKTETGTQAAKEHEEYEEHLFFDSLGMRGAVRLPGIRKLAHVCICIRPFYGVEYSVTDAIRQLAQKRKSKMLIAHDPLNPSRINGIYLPQSGYGFVLSNTDSQAEPGQHTVDLRRLVRADAWHAVRGEVRSVLRQRDSLLKTALSFMERAGEYHFELEEIYGSAMDFKAKEDACAKFCNRIP